MLVSWQELKGLSTAVERKTLKGTGPIVLCRQRRNGLILLSGRRRWWREASRAYLIIPARERSSIGIHTGCESSHHGARRVGKAEVARGEGRL